MGVASEALDCIRASLHYSPVAAREVPFINAANVLHHAGRLDGVFVVFLWLLVVYECGRCCGIMSVVAWWWCPVGGMCSNFCDIAKADGADAAFFSRMALQATRDHATICHFTLANVFAAQNLLDQAAVQYEAALRLQPEFDLALQTLRTLRCSQWVRRRKDKEILVRGRALR